MSEQDTITITSSHEELVAAHAADVLVSVSGSSLFTGRSALTKAKEVRQIVANLAECGIEPDAIGLESVLANVTSGILSKSSSATYRIRVRCDDLERLPDVLGAITSPKNATLEKVIWHYPQDIDQEARWLRRCIEDANRKAKVAADALGCRVVSVHRLSESRLGETAPKPHEIRQMSAVTVRKRSGPIALGMDLTQQKRLGLAVTVTYRVEGVPVGSATPD